VLGLVLSAAGCDDEFLTTVPQDRISDETFWQTPEDFQAALNAAYRNLITLDQMYIDGTTDLAYSQQYWMRNSLYALGDHDPRTGWHGDLWELLYEGLAKVNDVLARLEGNGFLTAEQIRTIEAEGKFLRGYYYHELLWMFGGVPLLTQVPTPEEAREITRAPRGEVFDLIMSDLTFAGENLPKVRYSSGNSNYGRATAGAALAYKARAALYEASYRKYAENDVSGADQLFAVARDAAQAVMDLGVYDLHPDFRTLFTNAGEGNPEVIFDYQVVRGQNGWWAWKGFAPASMSGNVDLTPTRKLVDEFHMANGLPITDPQSGYDPSPPVIQYDGNDATVISLGMYANRDPRFYATVLFPGREFNGRVFNSFPTSPTADKLDPGNFYNTHTGYMGMKYVDPVDQPPNEWNSGLNTIKMRLGDVLLMYAEAKIELGTIDGSVATALNRIRARAGMPNVTLGGQAEMIELVRHERIVELAWEGLRLADIRRWRIAEEVMPGKVYGIDFTSGGGLSRAESAETRQFRAPRDYLWPIPQSERDLNPGLEQNPGYSG
jgi:hypothetical protein